MLRTLGRYAIPAYKQQEIKTGIHITIPDGYAVIIRTREDIAMNKGLVIPFGFVLYGPKFSGEIVIPLKNLEGFTKVIENSEPVGTLIMIKYDKIKLVRESFD